jgi:hypothetical protein
VNAQESRQLKAGDKVRLNIHPRDNGTVIENSGENVLISWKDGTRTLTAHAGMAHVIRRRLGARDLLKLAPLVALALVYGFLQLKDVEGEARHAAAPVARVAQRAETIPAGSAPREQSEAPAPVKSEGGEGGN